MIVCFTTRLNVEGKHEPGHPVVPEHLTSHVVGRFATITQRDGDMTMFRTPFPHTTTAPAGKPAKFPVLISENRG